MAEEVSTLLSDAAIAPGPAPSAEENTGPISKAAEKVDSLPVHVTGPGFEPQLIDALVAAHMETKKILLALARHNEVLEAKIDGISKDNASLKQDNASLKQDIASMKEGTEAMEQANTTMKKDVKGLQGQVDKLGKRVRITKALAVGGLSAMTCACACICFSVAAPLALVGTAGTGLVTGGGTYYATGSAAPAKTVPA